MREDLADAVFIGVHRDVDIAAAGGNPLRKTAGYLGPLPRFQLGLIFFLGLPLLFAGGQNLCLTAAIAVDGYPLQSFLVGEHVNLGHILPGSLAREIDRLGNGVVR